MNLLKSVISFSFGRRALSDCLIAEIRIFPIRSFLITLRSENRQLRNVSSSNPISVAFSANHSLRSIFLVGAMAMCRWHGHSGFWKIVSLIATRQRLLVAAVISAL